MLKTIAEIQINPSELNIPKASPSSASDIFNLIFIVVGATTVIVMVIAGISFILSRGEPQKAARARNAIIYAAIGLIIALLAFSVVKFFVGTIK